MTGFLGKFFGGKKKNQQEPAPIALLEDTLQGVIDSGRFNLSYDIEFSDDDSEVHIELFGEDEELLKSKEGQLLDAIQLYLKRVTQHQLPDDKVYVNVDSGGFREESNQALLDLADKLKDIAINKGKSVYFRALPPKDRKIVHQYLAEDGRVKSRSVGDGHYKKIKIYPAKKESSQRETNA